MKKQNTSIQTIILVFAVLALGTFLHDPILHSIIPSITGGNVAESYSGFTTGQTTAMMISTTSPIFLWLFYMLPSMLIYAASIITTLYKPTKGVLIAATILLGLNIGSFDVTNQASDAYKAMEVLNTQISPEIAFLVHIILFLIAVALFSIFLYISIENNPRDSKSRAKIFKV